MSADRQVAERLRAVRDRIAAAARRADREPAEVTLVGVSKRQPTPLAAAAVRAGLTHLGESFVQEARGKIPEVAAALGAATPPPRWHLVGRLQRNKAGDAVRLFDLVQSLDGARLAQALARRAAGEKRTLPVLVQVNLSGEPQKGGVAPEALPELLKECAPFAGIRCVGLMTMPAPSADPEASRATFARLRRLRDSLGGSPGAEALRELSMGMTRDFEVAIEEGATIVRVGTAIFGPRDA